MPVLRPALHLYPFAEDACIRTTPTGGLDTVPDRQIQMPLLNSDSKESFPNDLLPQFPVPSVLMNPTTLLFMGLSLRPAG